MMRRARSSLVLLAMYWLALFAATHWPHDGSGQSMQHLDKLAHVVGFGILAWLWSWTMWGWDAKRLALISSLCLLAGYAAFDELTQYWSMNRVVDVWDWVANCVGVMLGLAVYAVASWNVRAWRGGIPTAPGISTCPEPANRSV